MKKPIGFEIKLEEGSKIVKIPIPDEQKDEWNQFTGGKGYIDYLKEFIGGEENYKIANDALSAAMHNSLSQTVKDNCLFCHGKSIDESDKACTVYLLQMNVTYFFAGNEFVNIVLNNRNIYEDKVALQQLTINFFNSLRFIKNEGKMYLDLEQLCRFALKANFSAISKKFSESEIFKNLQIINETLNHIEELDLENKVLQEEDENYLDLQKTFFEQKQRYYKEKLLLEKENPSPKVSFGKRIKERIPLPKMVLYYYYLQQVGKFPYFENHPEGKVKAIEEVINRDNIKTSIKHFQLKYNFINNHKTNRIAKNQVANIDYVANVMLKNYPEAKELALSELKLAQTKDR